jgi:hypothetical protein
MGEATQGREYARSRRTRKLIAVAALLPLLSAGPPQSQSVRVSRREGGAPLFVPIARAGSNYPFYSTLGYLQQPTEKRWFLPGALRPVIGTYHEDSLTVQCQLAEMFDAGQRRIALVLWFDDLSGVPRLRTQPVYGHTVNARADSLLPQHAANLRALVTHIRELGFAQLVVRFAGQGQSRPKEWTVWNETEYQRNRRFIWSTIRLVERTRRELPVLYDLDIEGGGIDTGQQRQYVRRLWQDYVATFPLERTIGVSVAASARFDPTLGGRRLATLLADYDSVGRRPSILAVDIYEWPKRSLVAIGRSLAAARTPGIPVIIMESYYDDTETRDAIADVRAAGAVNVVSVFQWPLARNALTRHVSMDFARNYGVYASLSPFPQ